MSKGRDQTASGTFSLSAARRYLVFIAIVMTFAAGACSQATNSASPPVAGTAGTQPLASVGTEVTDGWTALASTPVDDNLRIMGNPSAVWTGSDMIIPGLGHSPSFNPSSGKWRFIAAPPIDAVDDVVTRPPVWTGHEMVVFHRVALDHPATRDGEVGPLVGLAYEPSRDSWRRIADAPASRGFTVVVWAGDQLLVWGDHVGVSSYRPDIDKWEILTSEPLPARPSGPAEAPVFSPSAPGFSSDYHNVVWNGQELMAFPQFGGQGAAFDPASRTWRQLPAPPDVVSALTWTGHELLALDGRNGHLARLDPAEENWRQAAPAPFSARSFGSALWAGTRLVVWGGTQFDYSPGSAPPRPASDGASWDPITNTWSPMPSVPVGTQSAGGVFANDRILSWGATTDAQTPLLVAASWIPPH